MNEIQSECKKFIQIDYKELELRVIDWLYRRCLESVDPYSKLVYRFKLSPNPSNTFQISEITSSFWDPQWKYIDQREIKSR